MGKMMRARKAGALALAGVCLLGYGLPVRAETFHGAADWQVQFTAAERMESNFNSRDWADVVSGLQPGDTAVMEVSLKNDHQAVTDWYMTNEVLQSLEDASLTAGGGAYTYRLTYTSAAGVETVLFDSDTVGGEDISAAGEGLHEATDSLEDFFYLDTLAQGQGGVVSLAVSLDGETQGNSYQDTLAELQVNFAVELNTAPNSQPPAEPGEGRELMTKPVQTGDENQPGYYYALMGGSGLALLCLALFGVWRRKKREEAAQDGQ